MVLRMSSAESVGNLLQMGCSNLVIWSIARSLGLAKSRHPPRVFALGRNVMPVTFALGAEEMTDDLSPTSTLYAVGSTEGKAKTLLDSPQGGSSHAAVEPLAVQGRKGICTGEPGGLNVERVRQLLRGDAHPNHSTRRP